VPAFVPSARPRPVSSAATAHPDADAFERALAKGFRDLTTEEQAAVAVRVPAPPAAARTAAGPLTIAPPVSLLDFASAAAAEQRWAVEGIWPHGASGIIGGRPKDGKSTLAEELAISLWSGTPMFGRPEFPVITRPASVLYVQQENATNRARRDLQQILVARGLGAITDYPIDTDSGTEIEYTYDPEPESNPDASVGYHFALLGVEAPTFEVWSQPGLDLSSDAHQALLRDVIIEGGFQYVFLDPLYMIAGNARITDGGDELRPILTWLTSLRNQTGAATILTHHMTDKGAATNQAASLLGATWIHGWYEAALMVRRTQSDFRVRVDAVRDMGHEREIQLHGNGVGHWFYSEAAQGQTDAADREAPRATRMQMKIEMVRELLADDPDLTTEQLAAETGYSTSAVNRYVRKIREEDGFVEP